MAMSGIGGGTIVNEVGSIGSLHALKAMWITGFIAVETK
jgi:hypothetical protein